MDENINKSIGIKNLFSRLCFISFGICTFSNPIDRYNIYNIIVGIVIGLIFSWLFRRFLTSFLGAFNKQLKTEKGSKIIKYVICDSMLFLIPFALMTLLATFYLNWSMTGGFISAGIMAVGTAASIEIGKLSEKPAVKNTIITSVVSFAFSYLWTYAIGYIAKAPGLVQGAFDFLYSFIKKGGGLS